MRYLFLPEGTATEDYTEPLEVETTEVSTVFNEVVHNLIFAGIEGTLSIEIYIFFCWTLFLCYHFSACGLLL